MQRSKLMFSDAELQMACNPEIILTKNRVIEKVYDEFGTIGRALFDEFVAVRKILPAETSVLPKISKGEQYRLLPWVMLDYPRWFNQEKGQLAIRVMFWWGNYFLVQLQVSGNYLPAVYQKSAEWFKHELAANEGWWIGFPEDKWNFLLPQQGLMEASLYTWENIIPQFETFKIAKMLPIGSPELEKTVLKLARLLKDALLEGFNYPNDETAL